MRLAWSCALVLALSCRAAAGGQADTGAGDPGAVEDVESADVLDESADLAANADASDAEALQDTRGDAADVSHDDAPAAAPDLPMPELLSVTTPDLPQLPASCPVPTRICAEDGWCFADPLPLSGKLIAVSGSAPDNVMALGANGLLLQYDGKSWSAIASMTWGRPIGGFWVQSRDKYFASATGWSACEFWDGLSGPSIWGSGDFIWYGNGEFGFIGALGDQTVVNWSAATNSVWGSGPDDVWAVAEPGRIYHWDGTRLNSVGPIPGCTGYSRVWVAAKDDVWVSGNCTTEGAAALEHWDGTVWTAFPVTGAATIGQASGTALFGSGPTDAWAIGARADGSTLVAHWDGKAWAAVDDWSGAHPVAGWSAGPGDAWLVGDGLWHWDGSAWCGMTITHALVATTDGPTTAIWSRGRDDLWRLSDGKVQHWDGATWTSWTSPRVRSAWSPRDGEVWLAGDGGLLWRISDGAWTAVAGGPDTSLVAISGSGPSNVLVAGSSASARWDGESWFVMDPLSADIDAVASCAPGEWWAGARGPLSGCLIYGAHGHDWNCERRLNSWESGDVWSLDCFATTDIWAGGSFGGGEGTSLGICLHWNGLEWSRLPIGYARPVAAVHADGPGAAWLGGAWTHEPGCFDSPNVGFLARVDATLLTPGNPTTWYADPYPQLSPIRPTAPILGISGGPDGLWAASADELFFRAPPAPK